MRFQSEAALRRVVHDTQISVRLALSMASGTARKGRCVMAKATRRSPAVSIITTFSAPVVAAVFGVSAKGDTGVINHGFMPGAVTITTSPAWHSDTAMSNCAIT